MTDLTLAPNFNDADGFYERLIEAHEGLTSDQSAALNARLILILANQVGDATLLEKAISAARDPGAT